MLSVAMNPFNVPVQKFQWTTCSTLWIMFGCVCIACMDEHLAPLHSSLLVPFAPFHHANFSLPACYCCSGCRRCRNHVGTCVCGANSPWFQNVRKLQTEWGNVNWRQLKNNEGSEQVQCDKPSVVDVKDIIHSS